MKFLTFLRIQNQLQPLDDIRDSEITGLMKYNTHIIYKTSLW